MHETLLSNLMKSTDYFINIQLISFISSCFELISGIINPTDGWKYVSKYFKYLIWKESMINFK